MGTHQYYQSSDSSLAAISRGPVRLDVFGLSLADRQVYRQWVRECLPARSFAFTDFVAVGRGRGIAERLVAKRIRLRERSCRDILDCRPSRRLWLQRRQSNVPQFVLWYWLRRRRSSRAQSRAETSQPLALNDIDVNPIAAAEKKRPLTCDGKHELGAARPPELEAQEIRELDAGEVRLPESHGSDVLH